MGFNGPVCLTRSAPLDIYSGQLIFYDVIDSTKFSKSGVLSSIVQAGGEAVLPDSITLTEFKAWLTVSNPALHEMSFPSLCSLIKVADVLDDKRVDEWIPLAAGKLGPKFRMHTKDCTQEEACEGLGQLPGLLQQRVFAAAACNPIQLRLILDLLPSHFHARVLQATITDAMSLDAPVTEKTLHLVKALSSITASPPCLLSLQLHDTTLDSPMPLSASSPAGQQAATYLARALRHHSSLTSLHLKLSCINSASFDLLSPSIASLTSLQSLRLDTSMSVDSVPTLQQTLQSLPHLTDLAIAFTCLDGSGRRMHGAVYCLADMLSAATALTSLDISYASWLDDLQTTAPLRLPHLRRLTTCFTCCDTRSTAAFLSHLVAPLTSLQAHHRGDLSLASFLAPEVPKLFTSFTKFTQLKSLTLGTPQDPDDGIYGRDIEIAVTAAAPAALAALHNLQHLHITAQFPVLHRAMPMLAANATQLTDLNLRCTVDFTPEVAANWAQCLQCLSHLRLQRFALEPQINDSFTQLPGAAALPPLPHLTALRLDNWECITSAEDCEALARLTHLQKLHLVHMSMPPELKPGAVRCVAMLSALTSLVFRAVERKSCITGELEAHVPTGAWPALQELGLDVWGPFDQPAAGDVALSAADFVCRPDLADFEQLDLRLEDSPNHDDEPLELDKDVADELRHISMRYDVGIHVSCEDTARVQMPF